MIHKIKKISGDASFRDYYRIRKNKKTSIIVFAKKEKFKNLIVYNVINNILNNHQILAPRLINFFYQDNMMEITDLGDRSFFSYIKNKKNKFKDYKKLIDLILKLQKIKIKKKL